MKSNEQLRKEFEEQTGNKAIVFPACHGETGYASWEYQLWLEQKLFEEYAQQFRSPDMAEALRLKWITLTEDMGRMLSGQRGVSIDKLNKVMNLVQEFVNTLPASLSSPGSGWVKVDYTKPETLPEFGVDVIVYAPEEKDPVIIDHCFKGADGNVYWDWCNNPDTHKPTVTHWQPLPAPPGE